MHVRNIYTGKLAYVVSKGRHRVTVRLPDGSEDEWLTEEADFDVGQERAPHRWRPDGNDDDRVGCPDCGLALGSDEATVQTFCPRRRLTSEETAKLRKEAPIKSIIK
jgi:hypothetical protein